MKRRCIEDFEKRIVSDKFVLRMEEIKGGWGIIA